MRTVPLALLLLGALSLPGFAQDDTPKDPGLSRARPVRGADREPGPVSGTRFKVELHSGRIFYGIRRGDEALYWKWKTGRYVQCKKDERGAGIRLWFPRDQNGSMMIPMELVASVTDQGALPEKEGRTLSKSFEAAEVRASEERVALKAEREVKLVEEEKLRLLEEVAAAKKAEADSEAASTLIDSSKIAKYTALLAQFPPGTWTPDTPEQIAHRRAILGLSPSEEDMAFLKVFDDWKEAYGVWKKAQDKAAAEAEAAADTEKSSGSEAAKSK